MPNRFYRSISGLIALAAVAVLLPAQAFAGDNDDVVASLRVLTPNTALEPGAAYVTDTESLKSDPKALCFAGGAGGSGDRVRMEGPTALGLVRSALDWNDALDPISVTDEFSFGLGVCGIGGKKGNQDRYWSVTVNHEDPGTGGDQAAVQTGDTVLWYLTSYPPPPELEISEYPSGTGVAPFQVTVVARSCTTDFPPSCSTDPVEGASVSGGQGLPSLTDADGHAQVPASSEGNLTLQATKDDYIDSAPVKVCVNATKGECPVAPGLTIYGRDVRDQFSDTQGWDRIKAGGGNDRIDILNGGEDRVNCGAGRDKVIVDTSDHDDQIANNCERVVKV
jgi:hypothetical protein